jgi:FkbM family methyltransferase
LSHFVVLVDKKDTRRYSRFAPEHGRFAAPDGGTLGLENLMIFVSYAQNQEDVMLYRALRDVKQGFYIDVGAQDPAINSVTKAFYDRGWNGINVDPSKEYLQKLQLERPHDTNLPSAVGREAGVVNFFEVTNNKRLSTTSAGYAHRHAEAGYQVERREVPCATVDQICADCAVTTVHFLKIDVGGAEREVLAGCSFGMIRPWIVLVAAIGADSDHQNFSEWEHLLLGRRYRFVYFDGLNRFYIAEEHGELAQDFSCPPNSADQYVTYQLSRTRADLEAIIAAERSTLVKSLDHMLAEVQAVRAESKNYRAESQIHIANAQTMEDKMAELNRRLSSLQEAVADRDRQITGLHEWVGSLHQAVAQRDLQIGRLQDTVADRERQLHGLQANLVRIQLRVESLRSSASWKITSPLRETRRALMRIIGLFNRREMPSAIATSANSNLAVRNNVASRQTEPLLYPTPGAEAVEQRATEGNSLSEGEPV